MPTQKESIAGLVLLLKQWQKIEDSSIRNTSDIIKRTENPLINLVMDIIHQDSIRHKQVQQLIIDHYEMQPLAISQDDLKMLADMIDTHNLIEKKTIEFAESALEITTSNIVKYLLEYLLADEKKHCSLLNEIEKIKNGNYPYGGF